MNRSRGTGTLCTAISSRFVNGGVSATSLLLGLFRYDGWTPADFQSLKRLSYSTPSCVVGDDELMSIKMALSSHYSMGNFSFYSVMYLVFYQARFVTQGGENKHEKGGIKRREE